MDKLALLIEYWGFFMSVVLDAYDQRILALLQEDAGLSTAEIAERIGLSQSPCWRRIQRLKEEGVIRKQVTLLDRKRIGLHTQVFAQVKLNAHGRTNFAEFTALLDKLVAAGEVPIAYGNQAPWAATHFCSAVSR